MRYLLALVLALVWATLSGSFSFLNLAFGFLLGAFTLFLIREEAEGVRSAGRARRVASLLLLFFHELLMSAWRVAKAVLTPKLDLKPGIFAFPLTVDRDLEISLLANMITLTPGTLTVDVAQDRSMLYVHALDCSDPDGARRDIAEGFERKIIEALR